MSNPNKNAVDLTDLIKDKFTMRKDIAPVETSATASRAYKVGDKFYYGNLLQEATQDIAQGGTLTLNTNYKNADPVTTSIQNLSNQVSSLELTNAVNIIPFNCISRDIYTVHSDGSVDIVNSSAGSGETRLYYISDTISQFSFIKGKRYKLKVFGTFPSNCTFNINFINSAGDYVDTVWTNNNDEISFEWKSSYVGLRMLFSAQKSVVMNTTLKPMIVPEDFPITEWLPVAKSNRELTTDKVGMDLLSEVGAVNYLNNRAVTAVENGITWTVYDDKSMKANGTQNAPGNSVFELGYQSLKKGTYRLTGCPEDGGYNTSIQLYLPNDQYAVDYGDGAVFTLNEDATCRCNIWVKHNASFSNKVFKPMIAPVSYNGPYVPYAKSNKELTEDVTALESQINADTGLIKGTVQVFKTSMNVYCTNNVIPDWSNLSATDATDIAQGIYDLFKKLGGTPNIRFTGVLYVTYYKASDGTSLGSSTDMVDLFSNVITYNAMLADNTKARLSMTMRPYGNAVERRIGLWGKAFTASVHGISSNGTVMNVDTLIAHNTISTYKG